MTSGGEPAPAGDGRPGVGGGSPGPTGGGGGMGDAGAHRVLVDGGQAGGRWDDLVARAVRRVLERQEVPAAEISVALVDDEAMSRLNRDHLGRDRPTDVLAFPLWEEGESMVVGDVYLGLEQARRQAEAEGVAVAEELVRLAIHGTLHVLGWDHPEASGAREDSPMFRRQEELVREVVRSREGGSGPARLDRNPPEPGATRPG